MIKLADIKISKRGKRKVVFFQLGIYDLLKNHLGYRYTKINKRGYYLRIKNDGMFEVVNFLKLSESFREYISSEFENHEELKEISYNAFMNEYYSIRPITDSNYCKKYLSEDFKLTSENLHLILIKIDYRYRESYRVKRILQFIKEENFIETIDTSGNFASQQPLFYKRISPNQFLAFNRPFVDKKNNDATFDFWLIKVDSENIFLNKRLNKNELINVRYGFELERDIDLYNSKIY